MDRIKKLDQTQKAFLITSFILLLQITRNISTVIYVGILFASYAWLYIVYFLGNNTKPNVTKYFFNPFRLVFIFSILFIPIISLGNMSSGDFIVALPRYLITLPYLLFCSIYNGYNSVITKKLLKLFVCFMLVSALTIPFQIMFGPIPFFTLASERAGLVRYSSLAGSLPSLGSLGGFALAIILFSGDYLFKKRLKFVIIIIMTISMMLTLQKAAVLNILICFVLYFLFYGKIKLIYKIISMILMFVALYVFLVVFADMEFAQYINNIIEYTFSDSSLGVKDDLISRMWRLPHRVIVYNNMTFIDFLLGIGFPALAGTMGNPQYPMAHNNYFDLIFSGGFLHLISYMYLLIRIPYTSMKKMIKRKKLNNIDLIYASSIIIILINMIIGGGTFYQPVTAVIVYFIIFSYDQVKHIDISENHHSQFRTEINGGKNEQDY